MSRAFVKEDSGDQPEQLPERPISSNPNYMTRVGYSQINALITQLVSEQRALKTDSSLPAQARLAVIQRDLNYLRARSGSAIVVAPPEVPLKTVIFGCQVSFADEQDQQHSYRIVGEDEADIASRNISWTSPLAKALLGKQIGDLALWSKPHSSEEIEITQIDA